MKSIRIEFKFHGGQFVFVSFENKIDSLIYLIYCLQK